MGGDEVDVRAALTADPTDIAPVAADLFVDGAYADGQSCPQVSPAPATCVLDFDWYTRDLGAGDHVLQVQAFMAANQYVTGPAIHVTLVKAADPTVQVTSPTSGATVSGPTSVTVIASTAGWTSLGSLTKTLRFLVDGYAVGDPVACATDVDVCTASFPWDPRASQGDVQLGAVLVTGDHGTLSPSVPVVSVEPPPTVTIVTPAYDSAVSGSVTVTATGATPDGYLDQPRSMQLLVDGVAQGRQAACPLAATVLTTCSTAIPWFTGSLYGQHLLQVRMVTARTTVTSAPQRVDVAARHGALTLETPRYQGVDYVKGRVTAGSYAGVAAAAVTVTLTQPGRSPVTLTLTTGSDGTYAVASPMPFTVNTRVVAQLGVELSSTSVTQVVTVHPKITCRVPATVKHATRATVVCRVPGTPRGTRATLWYTGKSGSHVAAHARAKGGTVTLTFVIAKKAQRLHAWVVLDASPQYGPGYSATAKLHVV